LAATGRISIPYRDKFAADRALLLECYRPANHAPGSPVVIVQHGQSRNGREYCDAWISAADKVGALIVAITFPFPKETWPDAVTYNNGHVLDESGAVRPREAWSQAIPGRVFALLREAGVTDRAKAYLWGHSAGGQFVHRLLAAARPVRGGRRRQFRLVHAADAGAILSRRLRRHRTVAQRPRKSARLSARPFCG
jgi:poly(3-hydroxybutyrate) depolymerase